MKIKTVFTLLVAVSVSFFLRAAEPLYQVKITSTKVFEVISGSNATDTLRFYPLSEMTRTATQPPSRVKAVAADSQTGIKIKTKDPGSAIQGIGRQIAQQTGLALRSTINSSLGEIAPTVVLQACSETAVITLVLVPKDDSFILTCSYVIDERPAGSIDGTAASIAQMKEVERMLTADSIATTLPVKFTAKELKPGDYFRGMQAYSVTTPDGKQPTSLAFLMLKKDEDYTVGLYQNLDGTWTLIDQPVALKSTHTPHMYGTAKGKENLSSIRAVNVDGKGGVDLFVADGHIVKKEFAETPKN